MRGACVHAVCWAASIPEPPQHASPRCRGCCGPVRRQPPVRQQQHQRRTQGGRAESRGRLWLQQAACQKAAADLCATAVPAAAGARRRRRCGARHRWHACGDLRPGLPCTATCALACHALYDWPVAGHPAGKPVVVVGAAGFTGAAEASQVRAPVQPRHAAAAAPGLDDGRHQPQHVDARRRHKFSKITPQRCALRASSASTGVSARTHARAVAARACRQVRRRCDFT